VRSVILGYKWAAMCSVFNSAVNGMSGISQKTRIRCTLTADHITDFSRRTYRHGHPVFHVNAGIDLCTDRAECVNCTKRNDSASHVA
jgi:hypothetical protein